MTSFTFNAQVTRMIQPLNARASEYAPAISTQAKVLHYWAPFIIHCSTGIVAEAVSATSFTSTSFVAPQGNYTTSSLPCEELISLKKEHGESFTPRSASTVDTSHYDGS